METKLKRVLGALAFLAVAVSTTAGASHWRWRYRVLRSPHFELIYREEQKALAKRYILAAEQAHELLMPIFKEGPSKTIILLQDNTDNANGSADFLPYPHITVYPVLPNTLDSIDEYGDWPLEMMVHEYTHILNMYPAHGFYWPLKYIFGTMMRPNAVLPRWYLEGLAVDLETALTDGGRLRSSDTGAAARALVLSNRLRIEDLPRIGENSIPTWPYGGRPYLFGGWWWETVQKEKGYSIIETWNQNYSRRLPFLLNGPMREQTGKSAQQILDTTFDRIESESRRQIEAIKAAGVPDAAIVADETGEQSVFAISPSGNKLVYWVGSPSYGSQAKLKVRTTSGQEFKTIPGQLLFKSIGPLRVRWIDEDRIVYDQLVISEPYVTYRDIYTYDLKSNEVKRITKGARAQEAAPSPNGQDVAVIQHDAGRNILSLVKLENGEVRPLLKGGMNQRISGPEFLNAKEILFALRERSGEETLKVYNLETREIKAFNDTLKKAQNPRVTPHGVLAADAATGVRNIYWMADGKTEAVSNTLTAAESADYDSQRKELIYTELTAEGRRLRAIPFAAAKPPPFEPAKWTPPPPVTTAKVPVREESYIPPLYMLPRYWIPFIYQVEGGAIFQGMTSTQDPAGRNQYSLLGSYDTITKKPSYGVSYANNSLPTEIGMSYGKSYSYLGASGLMVESQAATLNFSQYWPFNDRNTRWSLGGIWIDTESVFRRMGPTLIFQKSTLNSPLNKWYGYFLRLQHTEYLKQGNYLAYGRSFVHMTNQLGLGNGHRLLLQTRAAFAPKLFKDYSNFLGDTTVGGNYVVNLANSEFLLRGYRSGQFSGRKIINANLEYVLPSKRVDRGWGSFPLFMQATELALFADTVAVDGLAWDERRGGYLRRNLSHFYSGAGAEARLNTTAAYHMPLSFTFGLYYGFDQRFGGGFSPFFGIGLGSLEGLQNKTP